MNYIAATWEVLYNDSSLQNLPYKIESKRYKKTIISHASSWQGNYEYEIGNLRDNLRPGGRIIQEGPISTSNGVSVAGVRWMSREKWMPIKRTASLPVAPEIRVEILSPSSSREEMLEKMSLHYAEAAQEVWLCDEEGNMQFFSKTSVGQLLPASVLCPEFPERIDTD